MLIIRLQRTGRENLPTYRLVLAEKTRSVKGKFKEILGHYLPARKPAVVEVKKDRVEFWVQRGAAISNTAARLLQKEGMKGMEKFIERYTKKKSKNEEAPAPAAPVVAKAPETPAPEAPATPAA